MNRTLIRKDARLLRTYLRCAVICTIGCYVAAATVAVWLPTYQSPEMQTWPVRTLMTLQNGSEVGMYVTIIFAAILAGSVFTLERADRSAEFLACLPPTRCENLISKLTILFGATILMVLVHSLATYCVHLMQPYTRGADQLLSTSAQSSPGSRTLPLAAYTFSVIGGGLAVSAWVKSNGVPILCGLLMPFLVLAYVIATVHLFGFKTDGAALQLRLLITTSVIGAVLTYCGCYWYLKRQQP